MASTIIKNASTFNSAQTFTLSINAPSLTITNTNNNTFIGLTLPSNVGTNNTSLGNSNFSTLGSGTGNVAVGQQSMSLLTTGTDSVGLGRQSGANAGQATRCTFLGSQSGFEAFAGPFTNSTAVGSGALLNADNQIMMGRSADTVVFPGNTTFNANLPTSTATPTTGSQFVTKTFSDTTYLGKDITTSISYTGIMRAALPYSVSGFSASNNTSVFYPVLAMSLFNENELLTLTFNDMCYLGALNSTTFNALTSMTGTNVQGITGVFAGTYPVLTTFSFPNIKQTFNFTSTFSVLTNFSLPAVVSLGSIFTPTLPLCTTFSCPLLQTALSTFGPSIPMVTTFSLPAATYISLFQPTLTACTSFSVPLMTTVTQMNLTIPSLTTFTLPALALCDTAFALTLAAATSISLSALATVGTTFAGTFATVTSFSLPAIISVGSTFTITAANLVTFSFGTTLKNVGGNVTMSGMSLNQASVDNILIRLAALDGTNGTTAFSSKTVNVSGGTSSTPSASGLTAKATLVGRGCTVTNN